jgi:hypothetical protein
VVDHVAPPSVVRRIVPFAPLAHATRVLTAIREDQLYVFTHPGMRAEVEARFATILAAMDGVSPP